MLPNKRNGGRRAPTFVLITSAEPCAKKAECHCQMKLVKLECVTHVKYLSISSITITVLSEKVKARPRSKHGTVGLLPFMEQQTSAPILPWPSSWMFPHFGGSHRGFCRRRSVIVGDISALRGGSACPATNDVSMLYFRLRPPIVMSCTSKDIQVNIHRTVIRWSSSSLM